MVSEALGHSSVTNTLDLYSHVLPNMTLRTDQRGRQPSKFEAMLAYLESQTGVYQSIDGLRRILVTPVSGSEDHPQFRERIGNLDNRMIVTAGYDSKSHSEAARDKINAFWKSMSEFLTGEPLVSEGEFVYGHSNR